ncbi:MAG: hypothetical protein GXO19_02135 [Epsilonproteobacteria bacterium]|nr:hypothetical protein [Campylobacterota bacterium]NPA56516.1 hypothetical protein [Campylobacterota bacterium]
MRRFLLWSLLMVPLLGEDLSLDQILNRLAIEDDLSKKTIEESAGSVIVFTREDLDRMEIKSLAEVIEKIPFMRFNENEYGLTDPGYHPFQPPNANLIKLYIDDREVIDAMGTGGLQLFSQMDLGYIDHIEIYFGAVSFTIGIEPSLAIIKLYTKEPDRENANIIDLSYATYGTHDLNFYGAQELEDYSYLIYYDHKVVRRPKVSYNGTPLSRNKHIDMVGCKITKGGVRFDFSILNGGYDSFISKTISLEPRDPKTYLKNLYTGLYYKGDGWKALTNFSYYNINTHSSSPKLQGVLPVENPPYIYPYKEMYFHIHESLIDGEVSREFKVDNWKFLVGTKGRVRSTEFLESRYGEIEKGKNRYQGDRTLTAYFEGNYLFDQSNIVTCSFKRDFIYEDLVENYYRSSWRLGYIRNSEEYTVKLFAIETGLVPQPIIFIEQEIWGNLQEPLRQGKTRVVSGEFIKRFDGGFYSFMGGRVTYKDFFVRDPRSRKITNSPKRQKIDSLLFRTHYRWNGERDKVVFRYYLSWLHRNETNLYRGGDLTLYKGLGKVDGYTSLIYRDGYSGLKAGYDLHLALSYQPNRRTTLYLKGINLLHKALKSNYYGFDPFRGELLTLRGVDTIDRTVWFGMEYQF